MFENKLVNGYTYMSRIIMSWVRAGGTFGIRGEGYDDFQCWLKEDCNLNDEDIIDIMFLAREGKLEYEVSAKAFLAKLHE